MLKLSDVTIGYNNTPLLQLDHFHLGPGDHALITGPSGCGKTTLLYAISGLLPALGGRIMVAGTDITLLSEAKRDQFRGRHIGFVFQSLHLMRSLSVCDNVLLSAYAAGSLHGKAEAEQMLARLGIQHLKDQLPETLSQGQAQRVAIARAVMHHPALILADEPTSSLDDATCETVIALLRAVARHADAALLVSTHDARVKAHFSQVLSLEKTA